MEKTKADAYMNWLVKFISDKEGFYSDDFLYDGKISREDAIKANQIETLYDVVENYCLKNYIIANEERELEYKTSYKIKYKDVGLELGMTSVQEINYWVRKLDNNNDCINFEDIKEDKTLDRTKNIKAELIRLEEIVLSLSKENVSRDIISKTITRVLDRKQDLR